MDRPVFVQHTPAIAVPHGELWKVWREDRVAIHWPGSQPPSIDSLNPDDYPDPDARSAVRVMRELHDRGGLVVTRSLAAPGDIKVGWAQPGSFAAWPTEYTVSPAAHDRGYKWPPGAPTALKTVKLGPVVVLGERDAPHLRFGRRAIERAQRLTVQDVLATATALPPNPFA